MFVHKFLEMLIKYWIMNMCALFFLSFLNWICSLFTFQMLFPSLPPSPRRNLPHHLLPHLSSIRVLGVPLTTHPFLPPCLHIPLHWGIKPSEDQGPLLSLMSDKAILYYICSWSYGSLHVYSLVGGLVPPGALGSLVG